MKHITLTDEQAQQIKRVLANTRECDAVNQALATIQAALAEQQTERTQDAERNVVGLAEQAEQEPVAYLQINGNSKVLVDASRPLDADDSDLGWTQYPLYTAPVEPVKQEPIGYQYLFSSPFGGDVWRDSSNQWNGNKPKASRAIYAAPVEPVAQEPVAEALRLSEEAIEYARQGGKVGSGIYGKALSSIRAAKEQRNNRIEEAKTTDYMLGFSDGKNYAHKYEQAEHEPVAEVVLRNQTVGFGRTEERKDIYDDIKEFLK